jgi:hypothetical protein
VKLAPTFSRLYLLYLFLLVPLHVSAEIRQAKGIHQHDDQQSTGIDVLRSLKDLRDICPCQDLAPALGIISHRRPLLPIVLLLRIRYLSCKNRISQDAYGTCVAKHRLTWLPFAKQPGLSSSICGTALLDCHLAMGATQVGETRERGEVKG